MPGLENEGLGWMSRIGRMTDSQVGDIVGLSRMFCRRLGREVRHKLKQDFFHEIGMNLKTNLSGPHGEVLSVPQSSKSSTHRHSLKRLFVLISARRGLDLLGGMLVCLCC
jgi:hypothetical protein